MPEQKFTQPVARAELIFFSRFPGPYQIPQSFVRVVWNPDRCEFTGAVTTRQLFGVAAVRLYPVAGFGRYQCWRNHFAGHTQRGQLPVENVAGRPRLIANFQMLHWSQLAGQLPDRFHSVRNHSNRPNSSLWLGDGNCDSVGVDIQTYKAYFKHWRPTPFVCGSAPLDSPLRSVTRVCYESVVGRSILTR
jgi:hypothetical protein